MSIAAYISEIARLALAIILLVAALAKSLAFGQFRRNFLESFRFSAPWGALLAFFVVLLEWLVSIMILAGGVWILRGIMIAIFMLTAFSAVIAIKLVRGEKGGCNCFGRMDGEVSRFDLYRNVILVCCAIYILSFFPYGTQIQASEQIPLVGVALFFIVICLNLNELDALLRNKK